MEEGDKNSQQEDDTSVGLSGVEVHNAIIEDNFRDACQQGELGIMRSIVADLSEQEIQDLIHTASTCTGSPLFDAIISQQTASVQYLLDLGCDIEQECEVNIFYPIYFRDKCTALCLACACGDLEIAKLLVQRKASVNHSSLHSSPIIYASEHNDVQLVSMLLEHGADIHLVPRGLNAESAILPVYQACLAAHKDTAELLLHHNNVHLSPQKLIGFLALLGAQCINKDQDYASGVKFWKEALLKLQEQQLPEQYASLSLINQLENFYMWEEAGGSPYSGGPDVGNAAERRHMFYSIFKDMSLCKTEEELDSLASDTEALSMQALLVLQSIMGPAHSETTSQMSFAARKAMEKGDLGMACRLFLYIIESNENQNQTTTATEYTSQLADFLLNIFCNMPESLKIVRNLPDILLSALELLQEGMRKVYSQYMSSQSASVAPRSYFDSHEKHYSKIRLHHEMVETFMAFLRIFVDQDIVEEHWTGLCHLIRNLLHISSKHPSGKFNLETEFLRIAVHGGQSAMSTLYFFQEELFPNVKILDLLLVCGASVNCQDWRGDTPLHYSLDCLNPNKEIVQLLLLNGAHIDTVNRYGSTPYTLLSKAPDLRISPLSYMTLKCLAARAIMGFGIQYHEQVPRSLEPFIRWHGFPRVAQPESMKSTSGEELTVSSTR